MVSEFDALLPKSSTVTLRSGFQVDVVEMDILQIFNLFDIVISGAIRSGIQLDFPDPEDDQEAFVGQLLVTVLTSIGKSGPEFVKFLKSMVIPHGLQVPPGGPNKQEVEHNKRLWAHLDQLMTNPNKFDALDIIEVIVRKEAPDLQELGKRIARLWGMYQKTGRAKQSPSIVDQNILETLAEQSTSYNPNMDGQTNNVIDSPLDNSGKNSQLSMNQIT